MTRMSLSVISVLGLGGLAFLTAGCARRAEPVQSKPFSLKVLVAGPLGEAGSKVSGDLIDLALPLQSGECKLTAFTPAVSVVRVDLESTRTVALNPQSDGWIGWLQRIVHSSTMEQKIRATRRGLAGQALPGELTLAAGDGGRASQHVNELLDQREGESVVWVYGSGWADERYRTHTFTDFDIFRKQAASEQCSRLRQGQELSEYVVLYAPAKGLLAKDAPVAGEDVATSSKDPSVSLVQIRADLEEGRLAEARGALKALRDSHPELNSAAEVETQMQSQVRVRIQVRKPDGRGENKVFDDPSSIVLPVGAREHEFRVHVEPEEAAYLYVYGTYTDDSVLPLFPAGDGMQPSVLVAGRSYSLPSDATSYELTHGRARLTTLYTVASRWPARELERLNQRLATGDNRAAQMVLQALKGRERAGVMGCDVRAARFELANDSQPAS